MECYSVIKKNEIMPFSATWIDLEIIVLSEVSQKERDKFHMTSYMLILKYGTNGASQVVLVVKNLPANVGGIRDTCTPMFITALFIIARTWKQARCP